MLPPPTTTAICTPSDSVTSASCRARPAVASGEMPNMLSGEANASPESFRRTRWWIGPSSATSADLFPELVAGEAPHRDLLPHLGGDLVDQLAHGLRVVADERLVQQDPVLVERGELALHDLGQGLLGLALLASPGLVDLALAFHDVVGDVVARDPSGLRAGDVERDVLGQRPELLGVRDEVGLAVHLDQHAHAVVEVDVAVDH